MHRTKREAVPKTTRAGIAAWRICRYLTWTQSVRPGHANKAVEAGVHTSFVHSSIIVNSIIRPLNVLPGTNKKCTNNHIPDPPLAGAASLSFQYREFVNKANFSTLIFGSVNQTPLQSRVMLETLQTYSSKNLYLQSVSPRSLSSLVG